MALRIETVGQKRVAEGGEYFHLRVWARQQNQYYRDLCLIYLLIIDFLRMEVSRSNTP